ncbi:MAG: biotin transport system substrate-specific component [Candidatus Tokpelaia sp. JSC161]|jgi:biotin transport system substrate-specific component|nr:MAG: biotin transport system substrate-specific component [Candidatus Tokpelaia sp. JSC161]
MAIKDLVSIALLAATIAALGFLPPVPIGIIPVPITAQTLGVLLAGALLGAKRGFYAVAIFWILIAAGLPLLPGGHGGFSVFYGPTGGYIVGFGFGAWLTGLFYSKFYTSLTPLKEISCLIVGSIGIHIPGVLWLSYAAHISIYHAILGDLVFIPGDSIKIAITFFIARLIRKTLHIKY